MWRIVQQPEADDYVLATGEAHTVREFVEKGFACVGRSIEWRGTGVEEKGFDKATGKVVVQVDSLYFRPTEVDILLGDPSKVRARLGWHHQVSFDELVREMVAADLAVVRGNNTRRVW